MIERPVILIPIILAAILGTTVFEFWVTYLNVKLLKSDLPDTFGATYTPAHYKRSQDYLKLKMLLGLVKKSAFIFVLLTFWFYGGFELLDMSIGRLGYGPIMSGLLFIGVLVFLCGAISMPFELYNTFGIEARFGFNRTDMKTFMSDRFKTISLAIVIGTPLLSFFLALYHHGGDKSWFSCWIIASVFLVLVQFVAPVYILPLFNRYEALRAGVLHRAILNYTRKIDFPLKQILVMDGSRRSTKSNAFFIGFGSKKCVVLFDTLIATLSVEEVVAILAHEIGHHKQNHILMSVILKMVIMAAVLYLFSQFLGFVPLYTAFGVAEPSVHTGLIFFNILISPLIMIGKVAEQWLSRRNEFQADRFAILTLHKPTPLTTALKKLTVQNMENLNPHPAYVALYYSHPTILERIAAIHQQ